MMTMFRLAIIFNGIRRFFFPNAIVKYDDSTLRFLESAMENMYGVDLHEPQHGHKEVQLKRFFTNYLVDQTGWSVNELSRRLMTAGIFAKGLSRRSLQYYVNTHESELTNENVGQALAYAEEYKQFTNNLNSIL